MYHLFDSIDIELNFGVWLGLLGALAISIHMVFTEHYIQDYDAVVFTLMQIIFGLLLSGVSALIFEPNLVIVNISNRSWFSFLYLGIACTVLTFNFQNWGQKYVKSMVVSLIVALEPIFATLFGVIMINESIDTNFIIGGIFILIGAFLAILFQTNSNKSSENKNKGK
jgi:drug/metabolite transporter (DMT)-like permease